MPTTKELEPLNAVAMRWALLNPRVLKALYVKYAIEHLGHSFQAWNDFEANVKLAVGHGILTIHGRRVAIARRLITPSLN